MCTQRIHCLHTHTVQAYTLLEGLAIILTAGVEHAHCLHQLALRDAAAIVAHADALVVGDVNLDALAGMHLKLVDRVVDDLLEQHIDTVVVLRAVAQLTDIHTGTQAHVLHITQVAYVVVGIRYLFLNGHI